MSIRIMIEPHLGATFADQLAVAELCESMGFDGLFRSDHFLGPEGGAPPGPTDAWASIAALAVSTERLTLGTLVSSATFRHPSLLAVTVAQIDEMSGGRVELGLGAGWDAAEHRAHGIPFPGSGERFDRLEEQLEILEGLWAEDGSETFSYAGTHYELSDNPRLPRPHTAGGPPLIIGGTGRVRTPHLAARFAAEYNVPFASPAETEIAFGRARAACEEIGRDPDTLLLSHAITVCAGRTEEEAEARAASAGRSAEELEQGAVVGGPDRVSARLSEFAEIGAARSYLELTDLRDLAHLELIGEICLGVPANG